MRELVSGRSGAMLGCVSSLVGTFVAAQVLFPGNPTPAGALQMSGVVLALFILVIPIIRVLAGVEASNAENLVAFGYVFWLLLDLIQGAYDLTDAKPQSLRLAIVAVGVSAAAMWVGAAGRAWRIPAWVIDGVSRPLDTQTIVRAVPICFLFGMFNFAYSTDFNIPVMFSYLGEQRWAAPWGRGQLGGWEAFRDQAPYFGYVLPALTALLISRLGLANPKSLFAVVCSVIMLLFLTQGGGRRIVGVTVGAALMVWVQANPGTRFKNFIVIGVGAVALAWTAQFMLGVRSVGYEEYRQTGSEYDHLHIDDNFLRLAQVIELVPARRDYVRHRQIVFTLVRPIPRVLWPGKPVDAGFDLPSEVGVKDVSLSMSIVGEWYLSFGWIAVIIGGWFHGRLAQTVNSLREIGDHAHNPVVFALAAMVVLSGMRSMLDLVLMSYALAAWWAVSRYTLPAVPAYAR
jgi:oligosaccharide repeat unit polymerase